MFGPAGVGVRPLEVEAEVGEALRRPVGQDDVGSRQEHVRGRVVGEVKTSVWTLV